MAKLQAFAGTLPGNSVRHCFDLFPLRQSRPDLLNLLQRKSSRPLATILPATKLPNLLQLQMSGCAGMAERWDSDHG